MAPGPSTTSAPAASASISAATSAATLAANSAATAATSRTATPAFALALASRAPQSTFETQHATPPAEFLAGAVGASGCGNGVLPQRACMIAFQAAWVSDHGGEGGGRGEGGPMEENARPARRHPNKCTPRWRYPSAAPNSGTMASAARSPGPAAASASANKARVAT